MDNNERLTAFSPYSGPLVELVSSILKARPELVINGSESQTEQYRELLGFSYDGNGPRYKQAVYHSRIKRSWLLTGLIVSGPVIQGEPYTAAQGYLQAEYGNDCTADWFRQYLYQLISLLCEYPDAAVNGMADNLHIRLLCSLAGDDTPVHIAVQLKGLLLESKSIDLGNGISLRQPVKSDFEQPIDLLKTDFSPSLDPTLILEAKGSANKDDTTEMDQTVKAVVCKLQLFCTCSLHEISYVKEKLSITSDLSSRRGQNRYHIVFAKTTINTSDEQALRAFINDLKLPAQMISPRYKHQDFLTTAFDRYTESLLENVVLERRITNAVMGIEALLSNEKQELSFRIQTRTARLLSLLDEMPALEIRRFMAMAYTVRSNYAHGGFLEEKAKAKIIRDFGELDGFAKSIIGFLRKLVLVFISVTADKPHILQLIDDSFIDGNSLDQLGKYIDPCRTFYR